jgi:hypothetical protein
MARKAKQDEAAADLANDPDRQLGQFADELTSLLEKKAEIVVQVNKLVTQARDAGIPSKALRTACRHRLETPEQESRREQEEAELRDVKRRLGDFAGTPLGTAAVHQLRPSASA